MSGQLYGLGVGPGDPELLTLKALRLLRRAAVVAYPTLEDGRSSARTTVAEYLRPEQREYAIRIPMTQARQPAQEAYDRAARELAGTLSDGRDVAVLCEGDPFFYGSFMYLFGRLADRFSVEVVPGVSSLTACAGVLGLPLAARNDVLTILPAPLPAKALEARLLASDAVAFIKVGRHLAKVRGLLDRHGLLAKGLYVERATLPSQKILPLTAVDDGEAPYFSMIIVHRRGEAWR